MTKHTEGPWRVSYTRFSQVVAANGAVIATCEKLGSLTTLQANARLISQAPALVAIAARLAALGDGLRNGNSAAEDAAAALAEEAAKVATAALGEDRQ